MEQKAIQLNEKLSQVSDEKKALEKKIRLVEKDVKEQTQLFQQATESTNNEKAKL
jgi:predicted  nucleic acid-binding Zn-ribbon protein